MKALFLTYSLLMLSVSDLVSQSVLQGNVTDMATDEQVLFCNVTLYQDGKVITGTQTDFDGNYLFENLEKGNYELEAFYLGYERKVIPVVINKDTLVQDIELNESYEFICVGPSVIHNPPLIDLDNTTSGQIIRPYVQPETQAAVVFKKKDLSIKGIIRQQGSYDLMDNVEIKLRKDGEELSSTISDEEGLFTLYPLKRGRYDIDFIAAGHQFQRMSIKLKRGEDAFLYVALKESSRVPDLN